MKPDTFDFLISQNVKEQQCEQDRINLQAENGNLKFQLWEADSLKKDISNTLLIANQENGLMKTVLDQDDLKIKKQKRQITGLKVGCVSIGILGVVSTIYFMVH